jgi:hypothetical protein
VDGEDEDAYRRYMGEVGGDAEDLATVSYDQQLLITSAGKLTFALGGNAILLKRFVHCCCRSASDGVGDKGARRSFRSLSELLS